MDRVLSSGYEAEVEVLESSRGARDGGDILRIDQDDLETVVPKEKGDRVRILNGRYEGRRAKVVSLDKKRYMAELKISGDGEWRGELVELDYEDFSMLA